MGRLPHSSDSHTHHLAPAGEHKYAPKTRPTNSSGLFNEPTPEFDYFVRVKYRCRGEALGAESFLDDGTKLSPEPPRERKRKRSLGPRPQLGEEPSWHALARSVKQEFFVLQSKCWGER